MRLVVINGTAGIGMELVARETDGSTTCIHGNGRCGVVTPTRCQLGKVPLRGRATTRRWTMSTLVVVAPSQHGPQCAEFMLIPTLVTADGEVQVVSLNFILQIDACLLDSSFQSRQAPSRDGLHNLWYAQIGPRRVVHTRILDVRYRLARWHVVFRPMQSMRIPELGRFVFLEARATRLGTVREHVGVVGRAQVPSILAVLRRLVPKVAAVLRLQCVPVTFHLTALNPQHLVTEGRFVALPVDAQLSPRILVHFSPQATDRPIERWSVDVVGVVSCHSI